MSYDFIAMRDALATLGACDRCMGRQFSKLFRGHGNGQIGAAVRAATSEEDARGRLGSLEPGTSEGCPICNNIFSQIPSATKRAEELVRNYGFSSFLVGATVPKELIMQEENLWSEVGASHTEPLKKEIVREIGLYLEDKTKKTVDFSKPDITILIDFTHETPKVRLEIHPLFIYGKYRKLVVGIPQTKWPCRECRGRGCKHCSFTGKMYQESVEEIVAKPALEATGAPGEKFHGSGREDIDARMLGWRPFVLQLDSPAVRQLDYESLAKAINTHADGKVEVSGLRDSSKQEVRYLKAVKSDKTYEALVRCEKEVSEAQVADLEKRLSGVTIAQRTPTRVSHRRADLVRKRDVKELKCERVDSHSLKARIRCSAGLYVKELISGDEGRTNPCFSEFLGPCECVGLDVMEVHEIAPTD